MDKAIILLILLAVSTACFAQAPTPTGQLTGMVKTSPFEYKLDDSPLPGKLFYIAGEMHHTAPDRIMEFSLFKKLNRDYNVRNLLIEYPYSLSYIVNKFMVTGDTSLLLSFSPKRSDYREFYLQLRALYLTLPPDQQFRVFGIDFELDRERYLYYNKAITEIFRKADLPAAIMQQVEKALTQNSEKASRVLNDFFLSTFDQYKTLYRQQLGTEYDDFTIIINRNNKFSSSRDKQLFKNFRQLEPYFLKGKDSRPRFFCQFGLAHVLPEYNRNFRNLVLDQYTSEVFTIGYQYYNCKVSNKGEIVHVPVQGIFTDKEAAAALKAQIEHNKELSGADAFELTGYEQTYPSVNGIDKVFIFRNQEATIK
jgi:hypothetical protein